MREQKGIYFGASITGGEGGANQLVVDNLGNNRDYTAAVVDARGAVVKDEHGRCHRLSMTDLGAGGVRVLRDVNDNPVIKPGKSADFEIGGHKMTITGTGRVGVLFNGHRTKPSTNAVRYPRT